jgi:hypothetical protein
MIILLTMFVCINRLRRKFSDELEEYMNGHLESITVRPEVCVNSPCNETCAPIECELCWNCLTQNEKHDLHLSYREIKHRGAMKKVFPPSNVSFFNRFSIFSEFSLVEK